MTLGSAVAEKSAESSSSTHLSPSQSIDSAHAPHIISFPSIISFLWQDTGVPYSRAGIKSLLSPPPCSILMNKHSLHIPHTNYLSSLFWLFQKQKSKLNVSWGKQVEQTPLMAWAGEVFNRFPLWYEGSKTSLEVRVITVLFFFFALQIQQADCTWFKENFWLLHHTDLRLLYKLNADCQRVCFRNVKSSRKNQKDWHDGKVIQEV